MPQDKIDILDRKTGTVGRSFVPVERKKFKEYLSRNRLIFGAIFRIMVQKKKHDSMCFGG